MGKVELRCSVCGVELREREVIDDDGEMVCSLCYWDGEIEKVERRGLEERDE